MAQSFDSLTAAQIAAGVSAGDFTATEVAQASLAAIEAREGGVQAFGAVSVFGAAFFWNLSRTIFCTSSSMLLLCDFTACSVAEERRKMVYLTRLSGL